jgi:hypothetical protein
MWHSIESNIVFKNLYKQETEPMFVLHKFICHYIDITYDIDLKMNETARPPLV